jgi:hypothetical protein
VARAVTSASSPSSCLQPLSLEELLKRKKQQQEEEAKVGVRKMQVVSAVTAAFQKYQTYMT